MIIKELIVHINDAESYIYKFNKKTLIYSSENSKGKTTLIRFILYAIGYQIPSTEGIGDFDKFEFQIKLENESRKINIYRKAKDITLEENDLILNFLIPEQETELLSNIFKITNATILSNLLAIFYIDQEKGWTLLNRGKIIGNNRFNIEEFVSSITGINIDDLLSEKRVLNSEIKKYRYFKNVLDINKEFDDDDNNELPKYDNNSLDELLKAQKEKELELKEINIERKDLEKLYADNSSFANYIENFGIVIKYKNEEILLTKDKLIDFQNIQQLTKIQLDSLIIKENKIKRELAEINRNINDKSTLFDLDDILENMENIVDEIGIDIEQIDKVINQLTNKRKQVNNKLKNKLILNNTQLTDFYNIIEGYAKELGIYEYISEKNPKFVLTNKLKGLSGRILSQMCYIFKLSYIKSIEKNFNLKLPIIIDSPRTNELSEESTNDMFKILKRDFEDYQIIVASIYEINIINFEKLDLNNGLLSSKYKENQKYNDNM